MDYKEEERIKEQALLYYSRFDSSMRRDLNDGTLRPG
jgi:hypothetical protein